MNRTDFRKLLSERVLILDGALGTELQKRSFLDDVDSPERLCLDHPERLAAVYTDYLEAGSEFILTNSFGANRIKLAEFGLADRLREINGAAVQVARSAAQPFKALVAADIGPLGSYLEPLGPVTFDTAYDVFSEQVKALAAASPDLLVIETMAEIREVKAALLAAKDFFPGPVIVQKSVDQDMLLQTGNFRRTQAEIIKSVSVVARLKERREPGIPALAQILDRVRTEAATAVRAPATSPSVSRMSARSTYA